MPFDPTLPVNNSLISSPELRNRLTGLKSIIDLNANNAATSLSNAIAGTAVNPAVTVLSQTHLQPANSGASASDSKQDQRTDHRDHTVRAVTARRWSKLAGDFATPPR